MTEARVLRLGVAGLSRAFTLMLPTFRRDRRVTLAAAADPRPEARAAFEREFGGRSYETVADLVADPALDAIYIASPHQFHAEHVTLAARAGKHVLVEKPMALSLAECRAMCDAAAEAGMHLLVGHSHSFDAPYLRARALIEAGEVGRVRMINALNCTDFLYRPRRPEELDTALGRRRGLEPGGAPGGRGATACGRHGEERARDDRVMGSGAADGGRVQRYAVLRGRGVRDADL